MTTARLVPVTTEMGGDELDAEDAWHLARRHGLRAVLVSAFHRFRYGDGFSHSRALALQACLAVVPFLIAVTGLAGDLDDEKPSRLVALTIQAVAPGSGGSDALARATAADESGEVALVLGLVVALGSMTTAMAQVERGTNRIYGIRRDRPAPAKYARAAVLTALLALPAALAFLLLVAGDAFAGAMGEVYGWSTTQRLWWEVLRWPAGLALTVLGIAVLLDHSPRRRQPALSWLALGAGVAVALSMAATAGLAAYVRLSGSFGATYGPLAGIVALLLWSLVSSVALFYGAAVCAQLEALRTGQLDATEPDPGRPHHRVVRAGVGG